MHRATLLAPFTTLLLAACSSASYAQTTTASVSAAQPAADAHARFAGTFVYAGDARERAALSAAIEHVISQLGFLIAPFARGPLTSHNPVYPDLAIRFVPGQIVIDYNHHTWSAPESGAAVATRTDFNDPAQLTHRIEGDHLVQLINSHDGGRRNEFYLSPDGATLTMRATMFSPRLPSPIRYALTYRRR